MAKKYLSLTEAAELLRVDPEELKQMRENGDIRGFADRGNWKFRSEDVDNLARSRQADSDPDLPIFGSSDSSPAIGQPTESGAIMGDDALASVLSDEDPGDDPTIIRGKDEDLSRSDSDVRLIVDDSVSLADSDPELSIVDGSDSDVALRPSSDSEVRLTSESGRLSGTGLLAGAVGDENAIAPEADSDSDVQLVANSDAEISLGEMTSDSDVRLGNDDAAIASAAPDSDSDVQLIDVSQDPPSADELSIPTDSEIVLSEPGSDSDVVLPAGDGDSTSDVVLPSADDDDDAGITLDFGDAGDDDDASVLLGDADDSGITLEGGSGLLVSGDSGISLEGPSDSGISLDLDDEGISLATDENSGIDLDPVGDSGISLEADSGIALADDVEFATDDNTAAEMAAFDDDDIPETQFELPAEGGDSEFDLDAADATAEFDLEDDETAEFDLSDSLDDETGEFDLDDADLSDVSDFDSLDAASVADIDLLEGDDAFDDESFESEAGASYAAVGALARSSSAAQQDWGTLPVVLSIVSMLFMLVAGAMSFDLLGNIYSWNSSEPWTGVVIESLSGMFG